MPKHTVERDIAEGRSLPEKHVWHFETGLFAHESRPLNSCAELGSDQKSLPGSEECMKGFRLEEFLPNVSCAQYRSLPSDAASVCLKEKAWSPGGQAIDAVETDFWEFEEDEEPFGADPPDWFDCPMLSRTEMFEKIKGGGALDGQSLNLFSVLTRSPRSGLFDSYLEENFYQPGSYYIYTTPDVERYRYAHWQPVMTREVVERRLIHPRALFSNTLAWGDTPPSERVYNAGFVVYTIEFDQMPLADQLRIIWSGKLRSIGEQLERYQDYRGCEAVYAGNKSVHFHFVFDIRHLKRELAFSGNGPLRDKWVSDLPDVLLRPAYAVCWDRLRQVFREIAEVDDQPDPSLRQWEHLRRGPWALRQIKDAHPLGLPLNHRVWQVVLSTNVFRNTKRGATEWFHEPASLLEQCRTENVRRRRPVVAAPDIKVRSGELELFEREAPDCFRRIIGADYPAYAGFEINEWGVKCYFRNGPTDLSPSSFCEGNRDRIVLQGRHNFGSAGITIGATPNQIFAWIVARSVGDQRKTDDWITRRYDAMVHDRSSLTQFLDKYMIEMVAPPTLGVTPAWMENLLGRREGQHSHVMIRGPQGCGKSTKILAKVSAIHANDPGTILVSSPSISQVEEKIETFLRVNQDDGFVPFLYLSLTALYEKFCPKEDRFAHLDILEDGGSSWLRAVYEQQRHVYDQMYAYRRKLHDLIDQGKIAVLFGTHETMRQHAAGGMTRIFYARGFDASWFGTMSPDERRKRRFDLLYENSIDRVIMDEVTAHDLVSIHKHEAVQWVHRCVDEIKATAAFDLAELFGRFRDYLATHPCDSDSMTWDLFHEIRACEYQDDDVVAVSDCEIPFDETNTDGIYRQMIGGRYYVRSRDWWNQFRRVTLLTTEAVPTRIIEALNRESAARGELQDNRFQIYEFELPESSRDTVLVELQRACKKETLPDLVRAYRNEYSQAEIISDMVKSRISDFAVTTHMSAKGSNAFIDKDIVAFYTSPSPALFGELGALNTRFGRSDLVRLFYCDQFEQTCGRNRGFRGHKGRFHRAVFPLRLEKWLSVAMSEASYVRVHVKPVVDVNIPPTNSTGCLSHV